MNEYGLFMDENEYKIIRLLMFMADLKDIDYIELSNEKLYTILRTLVLVAKSEAHTKLLQREVEKMEEWYTDQIFYSELEEILSEDEV